MILNLFGSSDKINMGLKEQIRISIHLGHKNRIFIGGVKIA